MAEDVEQLIPRLENVSDFIIAGHGMGAKIAQIVASGKHKGLIGLALINPVPASPWILSRPKMVKLYGSCESKTEALAFANGILSAYPGSLTVSDLDTIMPAIAIAGKSDSLISVQTVKDKVYDKIYGCLLVEVEDAGHLLPLERPKKLLEELQAFVDACVDVRKHGDLRSGSLLYQGFCMERELDQDKFMRTQGL
ncbi:hypothetical protein IMSHALPRED_001881 [Imshaugia aleurites]|uniref:Serine aminopeptidase S33 domain-containing protein n=1 Tax=Imshaugia aleurites TaxID=172621 RepID=A0A8H3F1M2_9LECA|nr:hypothetical protein IMSHALPRED_001881 [Imshaugia aleurites]